MNEKVAHVLCCIVTFLWFEYHFSNRDNFKRIVLSALGSCLFCLEDCS